MAPAAETGRPTPWITPEEAHRLHVDGATFVDARPTREYESGHIAGALSAPLQTGVLPDGILESLSGRAPVIAYCDTNQECAASTRLAGLLAAAGLPDVRVLQGGFPSWDEAGYPAEAGPCLHCL